MRSYRLQCLAVGSSLLLSSTGCILSGGEAPAEAATSLAAVQVPAGADLANERAVAVAVTPPAARLAAGQVGGLVLATPEGQTLFRGVLVGGSPLTLELPLALTQARLVATLVTPDATLRAEGTISQGAVALRFE